jgi:citrate lyase subunit beta/citryl-CoA lyase
VNGRAHDLTRSWLFGPRADARAHEAMQHSGADALIVDLEHAQPIDAAFTPDAAAIQRARAIVEAFEAARARGEDRALVDGLWVEVPTYRNAVRLVERARRLLGDART